MLLPAGFAQNSSNPKDSLRRALRNPDLSQDEKFELYDKLARKFVYADVDSALYYAQAGERLLKEDRTSNQRFDNLLLIGIIYREMGRHQESKNYLENALSLALSNQDTQGASESRFALGSLFHTMGQTDKSIAFYQAALEGYESLHDSANVAATLVNMGHTHDSMGNEEQSIYYYRKAIPILKAKDLKENLSIAYNNMASVYEVADELDSAIIYYQMSIAVSLDNEDEWGTIYPLASLGGIYLKRGQNAEAKSFIFQALDIASAQPRSFSYHTALLAVANYYAKMGETEKARKTYDEVWVLTRELKDYELTLYILKDRMAFEKEQGNYKDAFSLFERYASLRDSLVGLEKTRYARELEVRFEAGKMEAENEFLRQDKETMLNRQQWGLFLGSMVALLLLILVIILWKANRRRKKYTNLLSLQKKKTQANLKALEAANKRLSELNQEKDDLMGIVAHDLKSPLTKVAMLTEMLAAFREDPEQFQELRGRIDAVLLGGKTLIEELVTISSLEKAAPPELVSEDIIAILTELIAGFEAQASAKEIAIHLRKSEEKLIFPTHKEYLVRIMDNLISNAIKFSPAGKNVFITVEDRVKSLKITVEDQGPGIREEERSRLFEKFARLSNKPTGDESSTGLGLSIVKELVGKLGGKISVESQAGKGASFILKFTRKTA